MSRELEQHLERLLRVPQASDEVERRALGLALAALPAPAGADRSRRLRVLLLAAAATLALLAVAAAALATAGALHVTLGTSSPGAPVLPRELHVPAGAKAVAAVVDGRLWLTTRSGLSIRGLPVQSATLSPHALYVAAGIGSSLVAMAPDGARAWSRAAGGPVVAIAWAPDGLRIAYVVRRAGRFQLRTVEGNGARDRLLDGNVRRVTPSWRADSLAVAYVGGGGRAVVYDFAHDSHRVVAGRPGAGAQQVAFAPEGTTLAIASARAVTLDGAGWTTPCEACDLAWTGSRLVAASSTKLALFRVTPDGRTTSLEPLAVSGRVEALDATESAIVVAVARPSGTRMLGAAAAGSGAHPPREVLLQLAATTPIDAVSVR